MRRYKTFSCSVEWKNDKGSFWFQNGKLTQNPNFSRFCVSSHKEFQTQKKFITFLRWLDKNYPDTIVKVWERRIGQKEYSFIIPMGDNWKQYFSEEEG